MFTPLMQQQNCIISRIRTLEATLIKRIEEKLKLNCEVTENEDAGKL